MGAPALDPAAGCLPAAVSPGFCQREILLLFCGSNCSRRLVPAALSFPQELPADTVRPRATTSSGPQGPAAPLPCGDGRLQDREFAGLLLSTEAAAVAGRRRAAPVVIARICLSTADIFYTVSHGCDGRLLAEGRRSLRRQFCVLIPRFFSIKPHPTTWLVLPPVVWDLGSGGSAEFAFSLQWENTFSACSSLASPLPSASGSHPSDALLVGGS